MYRLTFSSCCSHAALVSLISAADGDEYWVLVDTTDRVAEANAAVAAADGADAAGVAAAAGSKQMDAATMAKFLNPTQFTDKQIALFKTMVGRDKAQS